MKVLFCEICRDIMAPPPGEDRKPRWCSCGAHAVWWEDGSVGLLYVWSQYVRRSWVLGIDNRFLMAKEDVRHWDSPEVVIRIRPGSTWDTFVVPDEVSVEAFLYARQRMATISQEAEDRAIRGMQQFVGGWASHDHWVRAMRERAWLIENQSLLQAASKPVVE